MLYFFKIIYVFCIFFLIKYMCFVFEQYRSKKEKKKFVSNPRIFTRGRVWKKIFTILKFRDKLYTYPYDPRAGYKDPLTGYLIRLFTRSMHVCTWDFECLISG